MKRRRKEPESQKPLPWLYYLQKDPLPPKDSRLELAQGQLWVVVGPQAGAELRAGVEQQAVAQRLPAESVEALAAAAPAAEASCQAADTYRGTFRVAYRGKRRVGRTCPVAFQAAYTYRGTFQAEQDTFQAACRGTCRVDQDTFQGTHRAAAVPEPAGPAEALRVLGRTREPGALHHNPLYILDCTGSF